jgi:alkylation response protein AidB-like acyl-CoA dehydrogenase
MSAERYLEIAAELAAEFAATSAEHDRTGRIPRQNLELARHRGVPALTVPTGLGGMGANLLEFAGYQERLGRGDGATALILAMHHMLLGGEAEAGLWPQASFEEVCRAAVDRGALVNSAASEPGAGSPSLGALPQTRAIPHEGIDAAAPPADSTWRISGHKAYTTGAPELEYMRVSARVEPPGVQPYGARFLVRMPAPEVTIHEDAWEPMALGAAANDEVTFHETPAIFLYREDRRGCEGNVWFQVAIGATYLGIGQAAHDAGRAHAREPITDHESVRVRLGRARAGLMTARRNLFSVCAEWVDMPPARRQELVPTVGLAKVLAVNAAVAATDQAMRLAGAAGLDRRLPLERFLRETRAGLAHPPVDDVAYLALAADELDPDRA